MSAYCMQEFYETVLRTINLIVIKVGEILKKDLPIMVSQLRKAFA